MLTYTIGTILRVGGDAAYGKSFGEQVGIPIAAGLIVGEALVGVGTVVVKLIAGSMGGA